MTEVPATVERLAGHSAACHRSDELVAAGALDRKQLVTSGGGAGSGSADPAGGLAGGVAVRGPVPVAETDVHSASVLGDDRERDRDRDGNR